MDARINSSSTQRNLEPITQVMKQLLAGLDGEILEIGCGAGEHIATFAQLFPELTFWPSDPDEAHRMSAEAWANHHNLENVKPALELDVSILPWFANTQPAPASGLAAIYSFNVIHITPQAVTDGLIAGASEHLEPGGKLITYGPYKIDGKHTAPSNENFDAWLKNRDPRFGVPDIGDVEDRAKSHGFRLSEFIEMAANNFMPVFEKT